MKKYVLLTALALLLASPSFAHAADEGTAGTSIGASAGSATDVPAVVTADAPAADATAPAAGEKKAVTHKKHKKHKKK